VCSWPKDCAISLAIAADGDCPSGSGANRDRKAVRGICPSTRCIRGDQDGRNGLYHINAVDQVTQWEIVAATPQISELWRGGCCVFSSSVLHRFAHCGKLAERENFAGGNSLKRTCLTRKNDTPPSGAEIPAAGRI
jgi:hypothetical protein